MLQLAASFVPNRAVAEEVVQDTWLAVLRGLDGFEGRSSLKTWLFRILVNRARTTGTKEQRSVPVADPSRPSIPPGSTAEAAGRIRPSTGSRRPRAGSRRASSPTGSGAGSTSCPAASARWCCSATSRG